jgi:hypothetical protein
MKMAVLMSASILLGSVVASGAETRAGAATGQVTCEGAKAVMKYAYAHWEKSVMYPGTVVISVVLTDSPVSADAIAAAEKEDRFYKIVTGGSMQASFEPDGKIQSFQLAGKDCNLGDLGGKASKFAIANGRLQGEAAGKAKVNAKTGDYAVTFDVPLAPRPATLK